MAHYNFGQWMVFAALGALPTGTAAFLTSGGPAPMVVQGVAATGATHPTLHKTLKIEGV